MKTMSQQSLFTEPENGGGTPATSPGDAAAHFAAPPPTFSIVVPTWKETMALARTLSNIVHQTADVPVEVIVVSDGADPTALQVCRATVEYVKVTQGRAAFDIEGKAVQDWTTAAVNKQTAIRYLELADHTGDGNLPRHAALKQATMGWVLFADAGTAIMECLVDTLVFAFKQYPSCRFVTWDIIQMVDPVPYQTQSAYVSEVDKTKGLPYVIPGVGAAVPRAVAQEVTWPLGERASDWAFYSAVWEKLFPLGEPSGDNQVAFIPRVMTIPYAYLHEPKTRARGTTKDWLEAGNDMGYAQAVEKIRYGKVG